MNRQQAAPDRPPLASDGLTDAAVRIREWYTANGRSFPWREESASNYERVVSEVLLQRTTAAAAARVATDLFALYADWEALADASEESLKSILTRIGLQERRSKALRALAIARVELGHFPDDRAALERLPAVGQYVASAILLFEHGRPEPLLDSNLARFIERFHMRRVRADIRFDPMLQASARSLVREEPIMTNWAMLDFGALVCKPRAPTCSACPLSDRCRRIGVS